MPSLVFLTFLVMSVPANIRGPLVPKIISSFKVSLAADAFLAFCFLMAYGRWGSNHSRRLSRGAFHEETGDDCGLSGGNRRVNQFRFVPSLPSGCRLAVCNWSGHGRPAGGEQEYAVLFPILKKLGSFRARAYLPPQTNALNFAETYISNNKGDKEEGMRFFRLCSLSMVSRTLAAGLPRSGFEIRSTFRGSDDLQTHRLLTFPIIILKMRA